MTLTGEGAHRFSRVTGANIDKRLAIVLDRQVYSAPVIRSKIPNGRAEITGMANFEEATGQSLFDSGLHVGNMTAKALRALLWACLLHDDPSLTLEQVGALVTPENMTRISEELNTAFEVAVPDERTSGRPLPGSSAG